jgi:hypothetical protein
MLPETSAAFGLPKVVQSRRPYLPTDNELCAGQFVQVFGHGLAVQIDVVGYFLNGQALGMATQKLQYLSLYLFGINEGYK